MMRNAKRVLSKAQILDRVWSYDFGGRSNIVELYVSYLRKKIDSGREPMIHTLRGRRVCPQARALTAPGLLTRIRSPRTWSLRVRLLVTQVVLLAVVCAGIGIATEFALQRFLMHQLDQQLIEAGRRSSAIFDVRAAASAGVRPTEVDAGTTVRGATATAPAAGAASRSPSAHHRSARTRDPAPDSSTHPGRPRARSARSSPRAFRSTRG